MAMGFTQQVAQWAASKPADEAYDYVDVRNCAVCQFLKEAGYAEAPLVRPSAWRKSVDGSWHSFDERVEGAVYALPRTFGALAERLK